MSNYSDDDNMPSMRQWTGGFVDDTAVVDPPQPENDETSEPAAAEAAVEQESSSSGEEEQNSDEVSLASTVPEEREEDKESAKEEEAKVVPFVPPPPCEPPLDYAAREVLPHWPEWKEPQKVYITSVYDTLTSSGQERVRAGLRDAWIRAQETPSLMKRYQELVACSYGALRSDVCKIQWRESWPEQPFSYKLLQYAVGALPVCKNACGDGFSCCGSEERPYAYPTERFRVTRAMVSRFAITHEWEAQSRVDCTRDSGKCECTLCAVKKNWYYFCCGTVWHTQAVDAKHPDKHVVKTFNGKPFESLCDPVRDAVCKENSISYYSCHHRKSCKFNPLIHMDVGLEMVARSGMLPGGLEPDLHNDFTCERCGSRYPQTTVISAATSYAWRTPQYWFCDKCRTGGTKDLKHLGIRNMSIHDENKRVSWELKKPGEAAKYWTGDDNVVANEEKHSDDCFYSDRVKAVTKSGLLKGGAHPWLFNRFCCAVCGEHKLRTERTDERYWLCLDCAKKVSPPLQERKPIPPPPEVPLAERSPKRKHEADTEEDPASKRIKAEKS